MIIKLLVLDLCISAKSADILGGLVNVWQYAHTFSVAYDCLLGERSGCNKLIKLKIFIKMKTPTTLKGYLKMLIQISNDSAYDIKNADKNDIAFLSIIRAGIQNELGEDEYGTIEKMQFRNGKN